MYTKGPGTLFFLTISGLLFSLTCCAQQVLKELHLKGGGVLRAEVVQQRSDRIVVDLGYRILSIPAAHVESVFDVEGKHDEPSQPDAAILYQMGVGRQARSVADNVQRCAEAVVQVTTPVGLGSGFIIHPDGYVVTNHHVVDGENRLTITLFEPDGGELRRVVFENVRIVALDPLADLALLKIEDLDHRLPSVPLGDSQSLVQGQKLFSIGSPLGFDRTISEGIVSLRNRVVDSQTFIQSTVQINPGNSGGPLLNLSGEVVGVNNMKIGSVGIEGLSFAIPARRLRAFLDNADAFSFDASNPNNGYRYFQAPAVFTSPEQKELSP